MRGPPYRSKAVRSGIGGRAGSGVVMRLRAVAGCGVLARGYSRCGMCYSVNFTATGHENHRASAMIKAASCARIAVMAFVTSSSLVLASCDADLSVPDGEDMSGCYYSGDALAMRLADGSVFIGNSKISNYKSGRDQSGSYIFFKPALHAVKMGDKYSPIVTKELSENYLSTIIELGKVTILMPTEPLGQTRLVRGRCLDD